MIQVNVHEAKSRLSHLLELVAEGEAVVIARNGTPVAELVVTVNWPLRTWMHPQSWRFWDHLENARGNDVLNTSPLAIVFWLYQRSERHTRC